MFPCPLFFLLSMPFSHSLKFHCKALQDQTRLLLLQLELEEATGETNRFLDLSLMQTIARCIENGTMPCLRVAQKLRKDFDVSERRWYHAKIRVLAKCGAWGELKRFSEEKRSPVGYVPFADAYIRGGKSKEAAAMIALIKSEDRRLNKLEDNKQWIEAALLASKMGNPHRVKEIYFACGSPAIQEEVQVLARKVGIRL